MGTLYLFIETVQLSNRLTLQKGYFCQSKLLQMSNFQQQILDSMREHDCLVDHKDKRVSAVTLLEYQKQLPIMRCRSCRLIYKGIECLKPGWMEDNLQGKTISVETENIPIRNGPAQWRLLNITLFDEKSHIYLELADFPGISFP